MKDRTKRPKSVAARRTMRSELLFIYITLWLLVVGCSTTGQVAAPLRIYIVTDLEGASGVYKFAQTSEPGNPLGEKAKEYLMGDIAAVVRGLRAANVAEIVVLDGHGSQAFVPHLMEPGAKYITGKPRPGPLTGLDEAFDGMIQLGAHAMMGTPDGVLAHTQSPRTENRYWYNGVESSELAQCAAIAGHYGVPTIMVTGDEATCREATKFFGSNCVTVAMKRSITREAAELYPFDETRQALYEGTRRAVAAIPQCQPYKLSLPIQAKKEYLVFDSSSGPGRRTSKEGTIDPIVSLISFWKGSQPLAVLSYYACHPQSYYRTGIANPDFPGIARFLQQQQVPDALHVHFNGAGGNLGAGKYNDGSHTTRWVLAQRLADGMKRAWEATEKFPLTLKDVGWEVVPVALPPAAHLTEAELEAALRGSDKGLQSGAAAQLVWLQRCQAGKRTELSCLRLGQARVLHMPGELFVEYQLAARQMRRDLFIAMAAYGDYGPGYIGTALAYEQGGYETGPRASNLAPCVEAVLLDGLRKLLRDD